jgi:hypothetical protein
MKADLKGYFQVSKPTGTPLKSILKVGISKGDSGLAGEDALRRR